jgi:hypothetical protein
MTVLARILLAFAVLCLALPVAGQKNPERLERATRTDDKGMLQWEEWKGEKCPPCAGTGKHKCPLCERLKEELTFCIGCKRDKERQVTCHFCAGSGTTPDPLEKVSCPGCRGASFLLCTVCAGSGKSKTKDDKKWGDCVACRGDGGWKCGVCDGARLVDPAALKPSFKDPSVKDAQKALATTEQGLKELVALSVAGGERTRKDVKAMVKAFEAAQSVHPAMRRLGKPLEDYMGKIAAGQVWQGWEENEKETLNAVKQGAEYYLKHQKRMLELVLKRAEANAKVAAEQKGK